MALRAVPDHPKFAHLKALLKLSKGATLGYLECVWHFGGRFTPQGNIGKYDDLAIESWVEWEGTPGVLIEALVTSRWLDRDDNYRILIHDWAQHADKSTKQALTRSKLDFCVPTVHTERTQNVVLSALPVPVPVPEPVPGAGAESGADAPPPARTALEIVRAVKPGVPVNGDEWFERLYAKHPKKRDRGISQTYAAQTISSGADPAEIERVHALYCVEWAKDKPQFAPTLAQWFLDHGWRYPPAQQSREPTGSGPPASAMSAREKARYDELMRD